MRACLCICGIEADKNGDQDAPAPHGRCKVGGVTWRGCEAQQLGQVQGHWAAAAQLLQLLRPNVPLAQTGDDDQEDGGFGNIALPPAHNMVRLLSSQADHSSSLLSSSTAATARVVLLPHPLAVCKVAEGVCPQLFPAAAVEITPAQQRNVMCGPCCSSARWGRHHHCWQRGRRQWQRRTAAPSPGAVPCRMLGPQCSRHRCGRAHFHHLQIGKGLGEPDSRAASSDGTASYHSPPASACMPRPRLFSNPKSDGSRSCSLQLSDERVGTMTDRPAQSIN